MRALLVVMVAGALAGGCKKKPAMVKTPVRQLAPLGEQQQAQVEEPGAPRPVEQPQVARNEPASDAGVPRAAPAKPQVPSVANPYITPPGTQRLPMYKQRAKFF